eukprot:scaffold345_cov371-Pavlova_lutheri.AAC.3
MTAWLFRSAGQNSINMVWSAPSLTPLVLPLRYRATSKLRGLSSLSSSKAGKTTTQPPAARHPIGAFRGGDQRFRACLVVRGRPNQATVFFPAPPMSSSLLSPAPRTVVDALRPLFSPSFKRLWPGPTCQTRWSGSKPSWSVPVAKEGGVVFAWGPREGGTGPMSEMGLSGESAIPQSLMPGCFQPSY